MIKDYKFKDIEKYLRKDSSTGKDILEAFDKLADAAIIFSPIVFGPQLLPLLNLLDTKDRLFSLGNKVYDFISQKIESDYIERADQLRAAYALICYTAYFEALETTLSKELRNRLKDKLKDKNELIYGHIEITNGQQNAPEIHCNVFHADHITSFYEIKEELKDTYIQITNKLINIITNLSVFESKNSAQELEDAKKQLYKTPEEAIKIYEAQYIKLADSFNDFSLFAQLKNFDGIHNAININQDALNLLLETTDKIDVGLSCLHNIINSIASRNDNTQVQNIIDNLKDIYTAQINEPIIDDKEIKSDTENFRLKFPKIVDAFIPQSYKCLLYQDKETKLENNKLWSKISPQNDLEKFFLKYLYSPDSIEHPLIILGHPGSGKSLLTKVLSAQLMSNSYTVVRIPLREVNAENGIDILVEDQIKALTNRPLINGYGEFAEHFSEKPLIIILDGYDELLQAKGDVFSGYLEKVRTFQQQQKSMKRPVRIIITSRITLIDKARIPINSTVLRLLEFDFQQRQAWIDIWNNINSEYFTNSQIKPFSLSYFEGKKKNKIIELAEQPLLLLMLALYDSENNDLAKTSNLKRTELYDNLLRRFVRRERRRYVPGFAEKEEKDQEQIIEQEMNRLGVAAIGMYNRQEIVILSKQLEQDLDTFNAHRKDGSPTSHTLQESDSLLGGFFFVHKSKAQDLEEHSHNTETAYEFLHNTFGEFLTADFILRTTVTEVKDVYIGRKFCSQSLMNKLQNPDGFNQNWFYCLMFVPLYSRPVIVEMLREHLKKSLEQYFKTSDGTINLNENDFIDNLKFIVKNQIEMVLNKRNIPKVMHNGTFFERDIPLIGYLATYSLNLIILISTLCREGFVFQEDSFTSNKASKLDSKPWDKLTTLWKTWFSPADLAGLSVIAKAKRNNNNCITIRCKQNFETIHYEKPIDIILCVSSTLADNLTTSVYGLQTQEFKNITQMNSRDIERLLKKESYDLYCTYIVSGLKEMANMISDEWYTNIDIIHKSNENIQSLCKKDVIYKVNTNTFLNLFMTLECLLQRNMLFGDTKIVLIESIFQFIDSTNISSNTPKFSVEFNAALKLVSILLNESYISKSFYRKTAFDDFNYEKNLMLSLNFNNHYRFNKRHSNYIGYDTPDEMSYLDNLESCYTIKNDEKLHILSNYFNIQHMELLLKTNPIFLSRAILIALRLSKKSDVFTYEFIHWFFEMFFSEVSKNGLNILNFNFLGNIIEISRLLKDDSIHKKLCCFFKKTFIDERLDSFMRMTNSNPEFTRKIIKEFPEIFNDNHIFFNKLMFSKKIKYFEEKNFLDYIGLYRTIINTNETYCRNKDIIDKNINSLYKLFIEHEIHRNIDIEKMTIEQTDNLIWFTCLSKDKKLIQDIKSLLYKQQLQNIELINSWFKTYNF